MFQRVPNFQNFQISKFSNFKTSKSILKSAVLPASLMPFFHLLHTLSHRVFARSQVPYHSHRSRAGGQPDLRRKKRICFVILTNAFSYLDIYICIFGQIYLYILTNIFVYFDKYIWQFWQICFDKYIGKSGLWSESGSCTLQMKQL